LRVQAQVAPDVPEELKRAVAGRKGALHIGGGLFPDAPDGCLIYLRWDGEHLVEDPTPDGVRNDFYLEPQTLLDLTSGELDPREAVAARLVVIGGDRSIYDAEDILRVLTQLVEKMRKVGSLKT